MPTLHLSPRECSGKRGDVRVQCPPPAFVAQGLFWECSGKRGLGYNAHLGNVLRSGGQVTHPAFVALCVRPVLVELDEVGVI